MKLFIVYKSWMLPLIAGLELSWIMEEKDRLISNDDNLWSRKSLMWCKIDDLIPWTKLRMIENTIIIIVREIRVSMLPLERTRSNTSREYIEVARVKKLTINPKNII